MITMNELIENTIRYGITNKASDIHLKVGKAPIYRINGKITEMDGATVSNIDIENLCTYLDVNFEKLDTKKHYDSSFQYLNIRFRVHVFYTSSGLSVALRPIPLQIPTINELELPDLVSKFSNFKDGLVLITGQTGSGKSTTIASIIQEINRTQQKHIVTIENPIEFIFEMDKSLIDQREIGTHVLDFSAAISGAMREDPDIVMIGEMRNLETMRLALTLAETGHLVFATLHSRNVPETSSRIIDVFPESQQNQIRIQLSNTLQAVMHQNLIPKIGGGRVPLCEVMVLNHAIRGMIRSNASPNSIRDELNSNKLCQTTTQSLANLYLMNKIEYETALSFLEESEDVLRRLVGRRL
jgi:twitching motility protein PilT